MGFFSDPKFLTVAYNERLLLKAVAYSGVAYSERELYNLYDITFTYHMSYHMSHSYV